MACEKCKNEIVECTCINNECSPVDAKCVIYKSEGESELGCFADIPAKTSLETILHKWEEVLCNLTNTSILDCARAKLNIPVDVSIATTAQMLSYIQQWICTASDIKVKTSSSDISSGYLIDKIEKGECMDVSVVRDTFGNEKVKIGINFPCLIQKIPTCFTIESNDCIIVDNTPGDCIPTPTTPVINRSGATLNGVNCNGSLQWYNTNNVLVGVGSNFNGLPNNKYYAKCATVCGESTASNVVDIPNIVTYTRVRTAIFIRNNCGTNTCNTPCTGSSVPFAKNYTSTVSQAVVDAMAENDLGFAIEGQANANTNGTCTCSDCSCVFPTYNPNLVINNSTCAGSVINANGQITIIGIANANKFGWSVGAGNYNGVSYADAITLSNFNQGNIETTPTSIKLKSLSVETRIIFRLFNGANDCYKDVIVSLTPPDCTQEQVDIEDVDVTCAVTSTPCKNWNIVAGSTGANIWHLNCTTNEYQFSSIVANNTTQVCSPLAPQVTGGVATENGIC